ncbi:MAG: hypothetical protein C4B59_00530 [Candidatus Methanogaster sp.]|uniref:Uncharacterized protein n=1 Tax=Candidatus Methanogaster sp. TaxID=3386292 RepID=A0AC61L724_9EURY|nr:MAG: hypothetical protein C4B59_00530 [ANME-2 cluster archaeon]
MRSPDTTIANTKRKAIDALGGIPDENSRVLEIGAGPENTDDICSYFLWQMKDLEKHLEKMEAASMRYCAVIQPAGRDDMVEEMWRITGERYGGEFDPDANYFAYLLLRQLGRLVDVRIMKYGAELDF